MVGTSRMTNTDREVPLSMTMARTNTSSLMVVKGATRSLRGGVMFTLAAPTLKTVSKLAVE